MPYEFGKKKWKKIKIAFPIRAFRNGRFLTGGRQIFDYNRRFHRKTYFRNRWLYA